MTGLVVKAKHKMHVLDNIMNVDKYCYFDNLNEGVSLPAPVAFNLTALLDLLLSQTV